MADDKGLIRPQDIEYKEGEEDGPALLILSGPTAETIQEKAKELKVTPQELMLTVLANHVGMSPEDFRVLPSGARRYTVIHRDSKTGMNLRVVPFGQHGYNGFEAIDGQIQAANISDAAKTLKLLIIVGMKSAGFAWKEKG